MRRCAPISPVHPTFIVWTHIDGTKHYAAVPANGILRGLALTTTRTDIKSVDSIPSKVTSIGNDAFYGCSGLTSITLPNSLTSIGESAFSGCSGLTSVRVEAASPPTAGEDMFDNTHANLSITVPRANVAAYQAADGWSSYASKISGY